jgi:hypothetical protein
MAIKKHQATSYKLFRERDINGWNFVIFLTLAFMLIVILVSSLKNVTDGMMTKAGLACPKVTLPNPNGCPTGWKYLTNVNGCPGFVCQ